MRLRYKFIGIYAVIFISVITVVFISLGTQKEMERISEARFSGNLLLEQSRLVRQLTKEVMVASFAPDTYSSLKDILYFENYATAIRNWSGESAQFKLMFDEFMHDPMILDLVDRGILADEHKTAGIMSLKAFDKLEGLQQRLNTIREAGLLGEDLYEYIQKSSDPDLIALFDEARQTSFYLANSFESFLNYFMEALNDEAEVIRINLLRSFIILSLSSAVIAVLVTLLFASKIVYRLRSVGTAMRRVASGDFSTPLLLDTQDEFEELAHNFNTYADTLKINLNSMIVLAKNVAETALSNEKSVHLLQNNEDTSPLDRVLHAIVEGISRQRSGDSAILLIRSSGGIRIEKAAGSDTTWDLTAPLLNAFSALENGGGPCTLWDERTDRREILAGPLRIAERCFGVLLIRSENRTFNDLDLIRFENFLEFAALLADNAAAYAKLLEERSAEYLTLQSQVQPHFIYNVLGGFAALNRMRNTQALEDSIVALRELLRYSVDHSSLASVAEELSFAEQYCKLQKMRFQNRLEWKIYMDEQLVNKRIPKLILQPLVENAIIHGIEPLGEQGMLSIEARYIPSGTIGHILLSVKDTGVGYTAENTNKGVGITNIERRLALVYTENIDTKAVFTIESTPGKGTVARIKVPDIL